MTLLEIEEEINKRGVIDSTYFGCGVNGLYRMQQNVHEFAQYIKFLRWQFPYGIQDYLEIGTAGGGTLRTIYELVGFKRVFIVDLGVFDNDIRRNNLEEVKAEKIIFYGDSHSKECKEFLDKQKTIFDLIFIDGDHSYKGALMDIELALEYSDADTIIGFHDTELMDEGASLTEVNANSIHETAPRGCKQAYIDALKKEIVYEVAKYLDACAPNLTGIGVLKKEMNL